MRESLCDVVPVVLTHFVVYVTETRKLGIMEVDSSGKVTSFIEKPSPDATPSRRAVSVQSCQQVHWSNTFTFSVLE